jgi:DNA-binding response OmpR family regulator
MENIKKKILLVEDDLNFGAVLKDYLMLNDFDVTLAKMVWKDLKIQERYL